MTAIRPWLAFVALLVGCGEGGTGPQPVASGVWTGSTAGMTLTFTIDSTGTGIAEIVYSFSDFECHGATPGYPVVKSSRTPPWPIADRQFDIARTSRPTVDIAGRFSDDGRTVDGTWVWLECAGTWTGAR